MTSTTSRPKVVLVVEDETLIRMAVAESLRDAGYRVLEAASAEEAISLLGAYVDVAVLFTDIQMPGPLNGAALTRLARRHHPDVTVIATSGAPPPPGMDVDNFMPKPYPPGDVAQRVSELLK
jgi:CheY-like chemotaxis protein